MDTVNIKWVRKTARHANGWVGYTGKWSSFSVDWGSSKEEGGPWVLTCRLPGIKERIGNYQEADNAKEKAQIAIAHWLKGLKEE